MFSLVTNLVVVVCLAYRLLQFYLFRNDREELKKSTEPRLLDQLLPNASVILISYEQRYGRFTSLQHTAILLEEIVEEAKKKIVQEGLSTPAVAFRRT